MSKCHIVFILTQIQGIKCGVGDYTNRLCQSIANSNPSARVKTLPQWTIGEILRIKKECAGNAETKFHLQYPSLGMKNSIIPMLLPLFLWPHRIFVTLHEFRFFHPLRKIAFLPISLFSSEIIFTNEVEKNVFTRLYPWAKRKCRIIPIGNNIPVETPKADKNSGIIYFGQIGPNKGIEFFIETVETLRANKSTLGCTIAGSVISAESATFKMVGDSIKKFSITFVEDANDSDISGLLSSHSIALLPFPDGITEKRGSALACLAHGNIIITRHTQDTPQWLKDGTYHAETPEEAARLILKIIDKKNSAPRPPSMVKALEEREWPNIAKMHLLLYRK